MRFKKGEKVEVMNKGEAPVSWRVAEILSGNGYTYRLRYDSHPGMGSKKGVYTVSRKLVRPCPPMVQGLDACVAGDIVEVSHEYSWKIGAILKVLGSKTQNQQDLIYLQGAAIEKQYLVRLLGSSQELIMDGSKIRMRQTWHGDKWILMRKSSRVCEEAIAGKALNSNRHQKMDFRIPQPNARVKRQPQKDCAQLQNDAVFWESPVISSRSLKRMSPYGSSIVDARNGCTKRARAFEKDDLQQGVFAPTVLKKGHSWRHSIICFQRFKDDARVLLFSGHKLLDDKVVYFETDATVYVSLPGIKQFDIYSLIYIIIYNKSSGFTPSINISSAR